MQGDFYTNVFTGGCEYQIRHNAVNDIYYIYLLSELENEENILIHTSYSKNNMNAFIEDLRCENVDSDLNL